MFDSGVRGASDVFKALALGAKFVFIGRLWVWGLSIMGEHGVRHVLRSLLADFDILLNVAGYQNVHQIDRTALGDPSFQAYYLRALISLQNLSRRIISFFPRSRNYKMTSVSTRMRNFSLSTLHLAMLPYTDDNYSAKYLSSK